MTKLQLTQRCRMHAAGLLAAAIAAAWDIVRQRSASLQDAGGCRHGARRRRQVGRHERYPQGARPGCRGHHVLRRRSGGSRSPRAVRGGLRRQAQCDHRRRKGLSGRRGRRFPAADSAHPSKAGWKFDTAAGRLEILYRRIGRNELDAIQTCLAYVDAQNEYAEKDRTGAGAGVYAQRIVSSSGKKDGLYWPASDGDASPLGEFVAQASAEGYKAGRGAHAVSRLLLPDPDAARAERPGGALDYVVKGKMIGGFALARLSRGVRQFRRDDLPRQSFRHGLPEGSR